VSEPSSFHRRSLTPDDLTTETLPTFFFGVPLVERPEILADIAYKYAQRGREMTPSNRKQALIPKGAEFYPIQLEQCPVFSGNPA